MSKRDVIDALMYPIPFLLFAALWAWMRRAGDDEPGKGPLRRDRRSLVPPAKAFLAVAALAAVAAVALEPSNVSTLAQFLAVPVLVFGGFYVLSRRARSDQVSDPPEDAPPEPEPQRGGLLRSPVVPIAIVLALAFIAQKMMK